MSADSNDEQKPVIALVRLVLSVGLVLGFLAGIQLYILSEHTDRYFAWTIKPPISAAFLGTAYWASMPILVNGLRQDKWANARAGLLSVFTVVTLATIVSFIHIDKFHLHEGPWTAVLAAWIWFAVYVVVPPLIAFALWRQWRTTGSDPPRTAPAPDWVLRVLKVHVVILLIVGVPMLLVPMAFAPYWPWPVTPLMGRVFGVELIAFAVAAMEAIREADWLRVRGLARTYPLLGALVLIAVARYWGTIDWRIPTSWLFVLFWITVLAVGAFSWRQADLAEREQ